MKKELNIAKHYCCGFIFSQSGDLVLLLKKVKPEWQKGYLNGVGGTVEPGETAIAAMVREAREETEIETVRPDWVHFAQLVEQEYPGGPAVVVDFFFTMLLTFRKGTHNPILNKVGRESPSGEGKLKMVQTAKLRNERTIPNLQFLIPLALNWTRSINSRRFNGPIRIFELPKKFS